MPVIHHSFPDGGDSAGYLGLNTQGGQHKEGEELAASLRFFFFGYFFDLDSTTTEVGSISTESIAIAIGACPTGLAGLSSGAPRTRKSTSPILGGYGSSSTCSG